MATIPSGEDWQRFVGMQQLAGRSNEALAERLMENHRTIMQAVADNVARELDNSILGVSTDNTEPLYTGVRRTEPWQQGHTHFYPYPRHHDEGSMYTKPITATELSVDMSLQGQLDQLRAMLDEANAREEQLAKDRDAFRLDAIRLCKVIEERDHYIDELEARVKLLQDEPQTTGRRIRVTRR